MIRKNLLHHAVVPMALFGLGLLPGTSRATITFQTTSPSPVSTTTNVGAYDYATAGVNNIVNGENLNQNNVLGQNTPILQVASYTDSQKTTAANLTINGNGGGQAFLSATSDPANIGYVVITPINPPLSGFTVLELNPFNSTRTTGTVNLTATDQFGNVYTSGPLTFDANGQNRIAAVAHDNQIITQVTVAVNPAADILKQFRLDYVLAPTAVPEPSTIALVVTGLGTLGLAGLRRRRSRPVDA